MEFVFLPSAFKHELDAEDILHALRNHTVAFPGTHDVVMHLGTDRSGTWLEVGTIDEPTRVLIVHAMKARRSFLRTRLPR
jgi:hypothetical protein